MAKAKKTTKRASKTTKKEISLNDIKEIKELKAAMKDHAHKEGCCSRGKNKDKGCKISSPVSCIYGLGFVGAAIYNVSIATSFWIGVWGIIKALVWPAFLVYQVMKYIGM